MAERIRIAMLIDSLARGGAERLAVDIACSLDPGRYEPYFVVTRRGGPLEAQLRESGIPVTILGRRGKLPPLLTLARAHRLLRGAHLLNAHLFSSSMWGSLLARAGRIPLVTRDPTWDGVRTMARTQGYRRLIGPTAHTIVCPSDRVARSIEDEGVARAKLTVITNGVKQGDALSRADARARLGLEPEGFVVGIVATLRVEKSHETLLEAFAQLRAQGRQATLCIVGDGPRRPELEALSESLGIAPHIVWAGDRDDARLLGPAFDAAVICSAWEGLPFAALELMAAGVPLVSTRVGALIDILADGAGLLVDVGDATGLAAALAALMDRPDLAGSIRARGERTITERFRFETMLERFVAVYESAVAGGPVP